LDYHRKGQFGVLEKERHARNAHRVGYGHPRCQKHEKRIATSSIPFTPSATAVKFENYGRGLKKALTGMLMITHE